MTASHFLSLRGSVVLLGALISASASAQSTPEAGPWRYGATLYFYVPSVSGKTRVPADSGGTTINFDVLEHLKFTVMGSLEAHNGQWGAFTDFIYLDVSGEQSNTREFAIGGQGIPSSLNANLDLGIKGTMWTIAGEYLLVNDPSTTFYVVGGARLLDVKETLSYNLSADFGPFVGPGRNGNTEVKESYWDAIIGVKGRYAFGANREWFLPYYADIGTGQSDLTWQAFGGIGYQFSWGSVLGGWRYIDYEFKSGSNIESLTFNGPMIGVAFNW